jgi:hypothetical protein
VLKIRNAANMIESKIKGCPKITNKTAKCNLQKVPNKYCGMRISG